MKTVRVWDLPTRLFHWARVLAIIGLVITGNVGGDAMAWHFRLGYAALTLVLFRLVWGFVGGHWSRFGNFVKSPARVLAYVRGRTTPEDSVGHNPLGALSVLALLFFVLLQATLGLMSDDEILATGPLTSKVPADWVSSASFVHSEVVKVVLIVLVALHVAAIVFYKVKKHTNLVTPMLSGDKEVASDLPTTRDDAATRLFALGVLAACAFAVWALLQWAAVAV